VNAISLGRLALVHPVLSSRVVSFFSLLGFDCEVSQGLRTWAQQDALCAQIPKVTEVCGGYSAHNFGYAVDVVPEDVTPGQPDWNINSPAWKKILAVAPSCGLAEGALWRTFPDNPHLYLQELPAEPTDQMRADFAAGGLPQVWASWAMLL
jgi:hypothetical protein